jgi:hypothetical protein
MSLMDSIKSTLQNDLHIVEGDADQIASAMATAGKQSFTAILETVLPKAKATPIGEILTGVYEIYKQLRADEAITPPAAPPSSSPSPSST